MLALFPKILEPVPGNSLQRERERERQCGRETGSCEIWALFWIKSIHMLCSCVCVLASVWDHLRSINTCSKDWVSGLYGHLCTYKH